MKLRLALVLALLACIVPTGNLSAASTCGTTYTVQPGDSLGIIAVNCNVPWTVLIGVNYQLSDPNKLWPGQVIRLEAEAPLDTDHPVDPGNPPSYGGALAGLQPDGTYIVKPGDSLARIAYLYHTSANELRRLNPEVGDDNLIFPGQRLNLPEGALEIGGWVGVNDVDITRGSKVQVNISNFPPFTPIDVNLQKLGSAPATFYDAETDALGNAFLTVTIPSTARTGDTWVVEVVTSERAEIFKATSPGMTVY